MKLTRAGLGASVLATTMALAACSSSGGSNAGSSPSTSGSSTSSSSSSATGAAPTCSSGTLNAAGSTAQTNAMAAWVAGYQKSCSGAKINYSPTGSGAGITSFAAKSVNFAGSDAALNAAKGEVKSASTACGSTALDLPMVVGPIALAYNISGVSKLTLTPELIAKIFTGKITTWNDKQIEAKNSGVTLPSSKINVIYRSDASGTTQNVETYMAATDPTDFTATPAKDNAAQVFKGTGAAKSQGVAQTIKTTSNSIGYDEYSFAVAGALSTAAIDSGSGAVQVSKDTASAAAAEATVVGTGDDLSLKLNYKPTASGAYPLILVTYEIACSKYSSAATGTFVKNFLTYTSGAGQALLAQLGYAPLPTALDTKVQASVAKIS